MRWLRALWFRPKRKQEREQIAQSHQRIIEQSHQKVEVAKERLESAAETIQEKVAERSEESTRLREALMTLIDRQSHGRFDFHRASGRDS